MMKAHNEVTSKRVASNAATLSRRMETVCTRFSVLLLDLEALAEDAKSISMSALTQVPDRKRK